ncbi:uncharacterized protein [Centroberyx affinis]|uniref:uncharacterized protein isoform X2 n=1 Tax=Centroberyx affinis TaxID=166261 RepID=UPI003A5C3B32
MDLSLLPTPVSEYNKQRTGARFTVRSANSPSYSLNRRLGLRRPRAPPEEERENIVEVTERGIRREDKQVPLLTQRQTGTNKARTVTGNPARAGNHSGVSGQCEEKGTSDHKTSGQLNQNGTIGKAMTESGSDRRGSCNPASESRGRTEWRRLNLPNRSKSLDWGGGASSPDQGTKAGILAFTSKQGGVIHKRAESLEKKRGDRDRVEGTESRVMSTVKAYNSAGTGNVVGERSPVDERPKGYVGLGLRHMGQTLERAGKVQSLPSRLKLQAGSDSGFGLRETASSFGPKGGQSILERIEKLYGSAGSGKTEDSTRIKDLSSPVGLGLGNRERRGGDLVEREGKEDVAGGNNMEHFGKYSRLKDTLEIPLNGGAKRQRKNFYIDETDFCKATSPEKSNKRDITSDDTPSSLLPNSNDTSIGLLCTPELSGVQKTALSGIPSPVSDEDKTPTNPPNNSPFLSHHSLPENTAATAGREDESTPVFTPTAKTPGRDSPDLPVPLATSSHSSLPDLVPPDVTIPDPKGEKRGENLDAWIASWNPKIKGWNDDEDDDDDDDDDDEGTEKDEDSNYDSDSGDSSVTITSNMSQSDRRSFCVSLADLCNFGGVDYESENDSDEWPSGRRSASLSSDISALSCVSVMPNEELDRLLEDVRGLGDNTLQDYDDVQVVVLHKEVGVGLGFSVAGGVDQNKPTTVHKVFPSGVAAQEGSIREGDQVLSINGTALCGSAHWEALRILRRARTRGMGVVVLRRGGVSSASKGRVETDTQGRTQTQSTETGHRVCVKLEKLSRDLGFSLEGGVGSRLGDRPLSIQKIFQGGPVSKVCPGDEVLEIEGVSVVGMRRLEAWTLIRRLPPGPVDVVLHRPLKHLDK